MAQTDPFAVPEENNPPRPMTSQPEPWQDPLGTLPPRDPLPSEPKPPQDPVGTLPPQEPWQDPLGTLPPRKLLPVQPNPEPLPRAKEQPFVDPLDMLPPRDLEPQVSPSPLPLNEPVPKEFPPIPADVPQFDPNKKAIPAPEPPKENPFVDPLDKLPTISPRPEVRPQPQEFRPAIDPILQPQPEPMPKENPFVDPLDNLPPISPRPKVRPQPQEFRPAIDPILQPQPEPMPKENPFVDPLDNLPPISPRPEVRPQPQEFRPAIDPLPQPQPDPMPKKNPFVDPLDNLPPISPRPEFRPEIDPLPQVQPEPQSEVTPDLDLNLKFLQLPQEDNERFLAESNSAIRRNHLSQEIRFDEWDRAMQRKLESPLVPKSYWDQLSHTQRDRLEQELFQSSLQTQEVPGSQTPRGDLQLAIEKVLPKRSTAGQPLRYEIVVENRGREMIDTVDVDEAVPPTHKLTDVTPAGHFENNLLRWRLREIRPGEKRRLSVEVIPAEIGTIETTTSVRPSTTIGSITQVEQMLSAALKLSMSAPKRVRVGDPCPLVFRITNTGSQDAENVILRAQLPNGLTHGKGRDMELVVGRLPAGATRESRLIPIAQRAGELENVAEVSLGDQVLDSSTTRTQVYHPPLRLRRFGYKTVSVNETVLFTNHVQNLTQFAQRNVEIVEHVPDGFQVVNVEDRGHYNRQAGTITWNLASLPAGETAKLGVRLKAQRMGVLQSRVKGETNEGEAVPIRARISSNPHQTQRPTTQTLNFQCASCCDCCCR